MKRLLFVFLCLTILFPLSSQEGRVKRTRQRGEAAGYSTRNATVLSMMGWGLVLGVGIATLCGLMDHNRSSSSSSSSSH